MRRDRKRRTILLVAVGVVIILVVAGVVAINALNKGKEDPYAPKSGPDTSSNPSNTNDTPKVDADTPKDDDKKPASPDAPALDPATVGTIVITPMQLEVAYVKGAGGFSYQVNRTSDGRRYVDFSSESLAGTKCTNDEGVFVSILQAPNDSEKATVSKTTTVDGTTYGLTVASPTCTSDSEALKRYQDSFTAAFSLLKKSGATGDE